LLERGLIYTAPLIGERFALSEGLAAFASAQGKLKVLLYGES
jgi:hypothetical protein